MGLPKREALKKTCFKTCANGRVTRAGEIGGRAAEDDFGFVWTEFEMRRRYV